MAVLWVITGGSWDVDKITYILEECSFNYSWLLQGSLINGSESARNPSRYTLWKHSPIKICSQECWWTESTGLENILRSSASVWYLSSSVSQHTCLPRCCTEVMILHFCFWTVNNDEWCWIQHWHVKPVTLRLVFQAVSQNFLSNRMSISLTV